MVRGTNKDAPRLRTPLPGPRARRVIAKDARFISPSYTRAYPLVVDRARGLNVWDVDGNRFLDFTAGVAVNTVGHDHPAIRRAMAAQMRKFVHMAGTDFYYRPQSDLAESLSAIVPGRGRKKVFLTNSGTESVEAAIKLARYVTRRPKMIAFLGGFHGRSLGALSLTASKAVQRRHFSPLPADVTHIPYATCLRCPYHLTFPSCDLHCVDYLRDPIFTRLVPPEDVAAVVVEPIQGEGGYIVPPPGYFQRLRKICDDHGILLVVDEIQSGFGRTGKMFAIEHWGVEPDILCVAKGIASGLPLGAMIARADLHTWPSGAHANTFGGNPVACAAALKTIELLRDGLVENAARQGAHAMTILRDLQACSDTVGDVRGLGLMIGVEIVADRAGMRKAAALRNAIIQSCFRRGLLLLGCGENAIRFIPSLTVTRRQIETGLAIFADAVRDAERKRNRINV